MQYNAICAGNSLKFPVRVIIMVTKEDTGIVGLDDDRKLVTVGKAVSKEVNLFINSAC